SSRTAQGASPGFKVQIAESPERAAQGVRSQLQINARHKARLFGTGTNCIAPSGLPLLLCLFPGLAPWAFLSRPCGASFAPETSLVIASDPHTAQSFTGETPVPRWLRGMAVPAMMGAITSEINSRCRELLRSCGAFNSC